ncbi:hypothetical protein CspeluHIS016_0602520 [Cutaneotrichosporon spelunceum]|uniref:Uncharacterized protein n=1 Tax=Cutaneotrichosporon spelunceum TaxID=1672016 RepID=A0AAD3TYI6_9TREE|nr:hypothetical protein CspeluHIS016_0602520 [Cutaneotrichosporon spelunceum]
MSASRLQRRACAPEPRGRGRSAVPKRTNSSIAFSCTSLDSCLHACGSLSISPASSSSSSSSHSSASSPSSSPPASPADERDALDLPPAAPTPSEQSDCEPEWKECASACESEPKARDHTTPYPYLADPAADRRLARIITEPSVCTPRPRVQRRSTPGRSPLSTACTLPSDV